jgi:hypothetical protein
MARTLCIFGILLGLSQVNHAGGFTSVSVGVNTHSGYGYGYGMHGISWRYTHPGYYGHRSFYRNNTFGFRHDRYNSGGYGRYNHGGGSYYSSGDIAAALVIGGAIGYGIRYYQQRKRNHNTYPVTYFRTYSTLYPSPHPTVYPAGLTAPASYLYSARYAGSYHPVTAVPTVSMPITVKSGSEEPVRRLLKDLDGKCYEIHRNALGDELRIRLQPRECNW